MDAQQHFKLIEAYQKRMQDYSENDYSSNFDMFYIKCIYPQFTFISCSQFLQIMRHLSKFFMISSFEVAVIKINLLNFGNKSCSFKDSTIIDSLLDKFIIELKNEPLFFDNLINLIMMFLNAKVCSKVNLQSTFDYESCHRLLKINVFP